MIPTTRGMTRTPGMTTLTLQMGSITGSDASNGENADDSLELLELGDYLGLQFAGTLSTLRIGRPGRNMDARPFEACPAPIALQICRV